MKFSENATVKTFFVVFRTFLGFISGPLFEMLLLASLDLYG
jgi:hypothetical protein